MSDTAAEVEDDLEDDDWENETGYVQIGDSEWQKAPDT